MAKSRSIESIFICRVYFIIIYSEPGLVYKYNFSFNKLYAITIPQLQHLLPLSFCVIRQLPEEEHIKMSPFEVAFIVYSD